MKYIAINKDNLTVKDQEINTAVLLWKDEETLEESNQYVLQINKDNESQFRYYTKHSVDAVKNARNSKGKLEEQHQLPTKPDAFAAKVDEFGNKFFKRIHGSDLVDIAAGGEEILEIEIGYPWAKIEAMEILGAGDNHVVDLFILDTITNTYSQAPVEMFGEHLELNQFAFDANVKKDFYRFSSKYDADLYYGMVVQLVVRNNSAVASKVGLNIELNEVRSS